MAQITVKTNFPEIQKQLRKLRTETGDKALRSTVNKAAAKGKTISIRTITKTYNIKRPKVAPEIKVIKAAKKGKDISAKIRVIRFRAFNARNFMETRVSLAQARKRRKSGTLRDLQFNVKRSTGFKPIQGSFVAQGRNNVLVFKRLPGTVWAKRKQYAGTKHAERIVGVSSIGVAQMFNSKKVNLTTITEVNKEFPKIFNNEIKFFIRKFNEGRR